MLIHCKECGQEISKKAETCPKCGVILKKKIGCLGYIGIGCLVFIMFSFVASFANYRSEKSLNSKKTTSSISKPKPKIQIYKEGETLFIGYTSYAVWRSWWADNLSDNQFLDQKSDANFLFVELTVKNDDKKARSIAPFKLIDENGSEYETTSKAWAVQNALGTLTSLNPSVEKKGVIVFDIPTEHKYKLQVSGGYWSTEKALVQLSPELIK